MSNQMKRASRKLVLSRESLRVLDRFAAPDSYGDSAARTDKDGSCKGCIAPPERRG
jgi:hypothetical protein